MDGWLAEVFAGHAFAGAVGLPGGFGRGDRAG